MAYNENGLLQILIFVYQCNVPVNIIANSGLSKEHSMTRIFSVLLMYIDFILLQGAT